MEEKGGYANNDDEEEEEEEEGEEMEEKNELTGDGVTYIGFIECCLEG